MILVGFLMADWTVCSEKQCKDHYSKVQVTGRLHRHRHVIRMNLSISSCYYVKQRYANSPQVSTQVPWQVMLVTVCGGSITTCCVTPSDAIVLLRFAGPTVLIAHAWSTLKSGASIFCTGSVLYVKTGLPLAGTLREKEWSSPSERRVTWATWTVLFWAMDTLVKRPMARNEAKAFMLAGYEQNGPAVARSGVFVGCKGKCCWPVVSCWLTFEHVPNGGGLTRLYIRSRSTFTLLFHAHV